MTLDLQRKLGEMNPACVIAQLVDGTTRPLKPKPSGTTRKRWMHLLEALERMPWVTLELQDGKQNLIGVIDNPASEPAPAATAGAEFDLKTMIAAQREALSWQDKSVRAALDTCVQVMRQMADAVMAMSKTYQMQIDTLANMEAPVGGPDDDLASTPLIKAMLPLLAAKLGPMLLGVPASPPAAKPNGAQVGTK